MTAKQQNETGNAAAPTPAAPAGAALRLLQPCMVAVLIWLTHRSVWSHTALRSRPDLRQARAALGFEACMRAALRTNACSKRAACRTYALSICQTAQQPDGKRTPKKGWIAQPAHSSGAHMPRVARASVCRSESLSWQAYCLRISTLQQETTEKLS